jgi:hypothetical protein
MFRLDFRTHLLPLTHTNNLAQAEIGVQHTPIIFGSFFFQYTKDASQNYLIRIWTTLVINGRKEKKKPSIVFSSKKNYPPYR